MANKFSSKLAQAVAGDQPWDAVLKGGKFILFSGAVPSTPETAVTSTYKVMELTLNSGVWTAFTQASMTVTITAIGIGNTIGITVGGVAIHPVYTAASTNTTTEASALALAINKSAYNMGIRAVADTNVVTLYAPYGTGTLFNGAVVANTGSGGTVTLSGNFASGVDAVNALSWERDSTTLYKLVQAAGETWSGVCPGTVTTPVALTYFRYILDGGDNGYSDDTSAKAYRRWQGSIGGTSSTADMKFPLVTTSVVTGVTLAVQSFSFTIPLS